MGLEVALILFGIIGQAASDGGSKLHHVAHVCLTVGVVMAIAEIVFCLILAALAATR